MSPREILAIAIYESKYSALTKGSQDEVNKTLSRLAEVVEKLRKKNLDDDSYDNFMSQIYGQAISDVLNLFKPEGGGSNG